MVACGGGGFRSDGGGLWVIMCFRFFFFFFNNVGDGGGWWLVDFGSFSGCYGDRFAVQVVVDFKFGKSLFS